VIRADLHLHSTYSDGKLSPSELVREAQRCGLTTVAITDHDTYAGYFEARATGEEIGVSVINGIEITTMYKGRETHLLAYMFDVSNVEFKNTVFAQKRHRLERAQEIIEKLSRLGVALQEEDLLTHEKGVTGRPHIASLMVRKGFVKTTKEAFDRYLSDKGPAFVKLSHIAIEKAIELVHQAGGVTSLAHPGLFFTDDDLTYLRSKGLDGIEYLHPAHNFELQKRYQNWAESHDMILTGGSDFHGFSVKDKQFLGQVAIDIRLVNRLREAITNRKTPL
jgi:predicted metal-dependent phosphoesterase TrpH